MCKKKNTVKSIKKKNQTTVTDTEPKQIILEDSGRRKPKELQAKNKKKFSALLKLKSFEKRYKKSLHALPNK